MPDKRKDINTPRLKELSWSPEAAAESLEKVFQYAQKLAVRAVDWYVNGKKGKRRAARWLRFGAIVLVGFAGVIPVLVEILEPCFDWPCVLDSLWASVFFGLAGLLVGLDRFFGFSSAWSRYTIAELQIQSLLRQFQLEWQLAKSKWKAERPSTSVEASDSSTDAGDQPAENATTKSSEVEVMLQLAKSFIEKVDGVVSNESNQWSNEFNAAVQRIDQSVQSRNQSA